jgi:O-antigen/teichoic acid export membrane protein
MSEEQSSYRQIMKATSLFGGVQVITILITIVRSKFIAVLLGPAGMGIAGLLTSTTGLIGGLTNFGLGTSAVKNIASAYGTGDEKRISVVITVLRRWVWITGLLGMIVTILTAPMLSKLTFGNSSYTFPFIWISISLLLGQLSSSQMVLLQGMRKLQSLAKANIFGSILGLIITVPLYYFLGEKGIVPSIIISSVTSVFISWFFTRKIKVQKVYVSKEVTVKEGKEMLVMGFMISLSGLITLFASYIVRIFISNHGGVDQVGLYNAGFAIVNSYVGLVFVAMGTDYYPRLSAVSSNNLECKKVINQQAEISVLIIAPIIVLFLVFINWIVLIMYSSQFILVKDMILWAALGMFFKAAAWAIGFIFLAKGANKIFFWSELSGNTYTLLLNVLGYYLYGLTGLGISFIIGYLLVLIQVYVIAHYKYDFKFEKPIFIIFFIQFAIALLAFLSALLIGGGTSYIIGSLLFLLSISLVYKELDSRIGIKLIFKNFLNRNNG